MKRQSRSDQYAPIQEAEAEDQAFLKPADEESVALDGKLNVRQTAKLGFEFCLLWVQTDLKGRHKERKLTGTVCGTVSENVFDPSPRPLTLI